MTTVENVIQGYPMMNNEQTTSVVLGEIPLYAAVTYSAEVPVEIHVKQNPKNLSDKEIGNLLNGNQVVAQQLLRNDEFNFRLEFQCGTVLQLCSKDIAYDWVEHNGFYDPQVFEFEMDEEYDRVMDEWLEGTSEDRA